MDKKDLERLICDRYSVEPERLWLKYPSYEVFRHNSSQKWFALIMEIPKNKLGLPDSEKMDILDLKCDPILIGSLLNEPGFFPAYHMNKNSWITIALDGSAADDKIETLLYMSYKAAAPKIKKKKC